MTAETVERRADGIEDPVDEIAHFVRGFDCDQYDGKLMSSQAGDEAAGADAVTQADSDRFEGIAERMTKGVIDALELIDVDVEYRDMIVRQDVSKRVSEPLWNKVRFGRSVNACWPIAGRAGETFRRGSDRTCRPSSRPDEWLRCERRVRPP